MRLSLDPAGFITAHSSPRDRERMKQIPGARYHAPSQTWRLAPGWPTMLAVGAVLAGEVEPDPEVRELVGNYMRRNITIGEAKQMEGEILVPSTSHLYPFQRSGARFLATAGQALLADEMGTGKTIQTIAALLGLHHAEHDCWPALIICTNSMKHTWAEEFRRWAPAIETYVVDGSAAKRRKLLAEFGESDPAWPGVVIINWESVRLHTRLAAYGSLRLSDAEKEPHELDWASFRTVVVDEAHRMVDPKAKQTRAVWNLLHKATYRWALTGTPITAKPENLWAILHGLVPEEFPSRSKFIDRYVVAWSNFFGGLETAGLRPDTREEFFKAVSPRFFRRTKAEVLPHLPPKVYTERIVTMGTKQRKAYTNMVDDMIHQLDDGTLDIATNSLVLDGKLRAYAALTEGQTVPSCKVEALLEIVEEAGPEQVVVYCWHKALVSACADALAKAKVTYGRITGDEAPIDRTEAMAAFQAGNLQVILCTLGAGSEGITLTAASRVVFLQRSYSMVQNLQAEDRLHRDGQTAESVEVIDVLAADTMEDDVLWASAQKEGRLQEVCRDPSWLRKVLS